MDRRTLFKRTIQGGALLTTGIIGVPAAVTALSPVLRDRRPSLWRPVAPAGDFPIGQITKATVNLADDAWPRTLDAQAVYVWRQSADDFVVFSRSCTDLGCPVNYDPGSECFYCPCHGGIFNKNGERMAGPPPRPLYRYAYRIQNGVLEIDLASVPPVA